MSQAPPNAGQAPGLPGSSMTHVRAATPPLRPRRLFFLWMRCGAVCTSERD